MPEIDETIWLKFVEGDKASFEKLMHTHYKDLFDYGTKFSPDTELVKDCIQDLFLNLWNKRKVISKPVNTKAYLFASLRRSLHREIISHDKAVSLDSLANAANSFNFQVSIEQQFITKESSNIIAQRLAAYLQTLPARQKEVILLKYFKGLSRDEVAEVMNISTQTVSNLMQMGLKKLRTDFKHPFDQYVLSIILPVVVKLF